MLEKQQQDNLRAEESKSKINAAPAGSLYAKGEQIEEENEEEQSPRNFDDILKAYQKNIRNQQNINQ